MYKQTAEISHNIATVIDDSLLPVGAVGMSFLATALYRQDNTGALLSFAVSSRNAATLATAVYDVHHNDGRTFKRIPADSLGMTLEAVGLGFRFASSAVRETYPTTSKTLRLLGNVVGFSGVGLGLLALHKHASDARTAKLSTRYPRVINNRGSSDS